MAGTVALSFLEKGLSVISFQSLVNPILHSAASQAPRNTAHEHSCGKNHLSVTEEPVLSETRCSTNSRTNELKCPTVLFQQNCPPCLLPQEFSEYLCKMGIFNWKIFTVLFNLTFPVQPTPFQIQKYTRIQAIARVIASGHRICPGFSNPSVIWCMLRLE